MSEPELSKEQFQSMGRELQALLKQADYHEERKTAQAWLFRHKWPDLYPDISIPIALCTLEEANALLAKSKIRNRLALEHGNIVRVLAPPPQSPAKPAPPPPQKPFWEHCGLDSPLKLIAAILSGVVALFGVLFIGYQIGAGQQTDKAALAEMRKGIQQLRQEIAQMRPPSAPSPETQTPTISSDPAPAAPQSGPSQPARP
ncbi:hypothetical protein [Magnetofaba australis]|uniref:Uncharacterized protein n=1 Tax=Magnetofaba australis IT-1 TaxID=1434232 RepID=A0A1Y2K937_9PROT|nr:hypothetical protein [Magnetofaba australis]OSM07265.1 hypothetical protein MAIT1_04518 [Magnetofaba australis IT-1]